MSYPKRVRLSVTLDGTGAIDTDFPEAIRGKIHQIVYTKNNFTNGSTITLTNRATGETIWTETGVNASAVRAPRIPLHSTAGVAALFAAGGTALLERIAVAGDLVRCVISGGGAAATGIFDIIFE